MRPLHPFPDPPRGRRASRGAQPTRRPSMTGRGTLGGILVFGLLVTAGVAAAGETTAVGTKVANAGTLRDLRGGRRALQGFTGKKALVLAFVGTDCPLSNLYLPG